MAITGTQQPTSPSINLQPSNNKVYTRVFKYARDYAWEAEMPVVGSFDATYGYFRGYQSANGPAYVTVTLTYDTEGTIVNFAPGDGDTEYWAQTVGEEKPIEYNGGYLTKWNYGLYGIDNGGAAKTTADYPGGAAAYNTATTTAALVGNVELRWFKENPGIGYYQIQPPTKNVNFYLAPTRAVFKRDYHRGQTAAENDLEDVGKLVVPSETFGALPSAAANWLVVSSNTQYDGKYWVTETEYWHSENDWDSDIYSVP